MTTTREQVEAEIVAWLRRIERPWAKPAELADDIARGAHRTEPQPEGGTPKKATADMVRILIKELLRDWRWPWSDPPEMCTERALNAALAASVPEGEK